MRAFLRIALALAAMVLCLATVQPGIARAATIPSTSELLSPPPGSNGETYDECITRGAAAATIAIDFYDANADGLGPVWQWFTQDFTPAYLDFVRGCGALQNGGSGGSAGGSGGGGSGGGSSGGGPTPQLDCQATAASSEASLDPGQSISVQVNAPAGTSIDSVSVSWGDGSFSVGTTNASHTYPAPATTYTVQASVTGTVTDATGSHPCATSVGVGKIQVFSLPWNTLLDRAVLLYSEAKKRGVTAIGYYQQILNLVCAAAQSQRADCSAMIPSYSKAPAAWAGTWSYTVFSSYLTTLDPAKIDAQLDQLQAVVDDAEGKLSLVCPRDGFLTLSEACSLARRGLVTPGDEAALIVGTLHFWNDLGPGFQSATNNVVQQIPANASLSVIRTDLAALRTEHQNLFNNAVTPGFDAVAGSGQLSPLATAVANTGVPLFAGVYREGAIITALDKRYGLLRGLSIYVSTRN